MHVKWNCGYMTILETKMEKENDVQPTKFIAMG